MMKQNYKEFKKRDVLKPFFLKTEETLRTIYLEID
jgi:hypothetical protein